MGTVMKKCISIWLYVWYQSNMPRKARIDAPGALHHIISRGIERRKIFDDDADRDNFLERLGIILKETSTPCYGWRWYRIIFSGQTIRDERNNRRQTDRYKSTGSEPGSRARRKINSGYEFKLNKMRNVFFHVPILFWSQALGTQ